MLKRACLPFALPLAVVLLGAASPVRAELSARDMTSRSFELMRSRSEVPSVLDLKTVMAEKPTFRTKIKRRLGRTPIIEVTFNGSHPFEMIVDTGANDTVITQRMAAEMGIVPVAKLKFDTASARGVEMPLGRIKLVTVNGAMARNLLVAIAGPELHTGLLGHDFFGHYDLTIKQDVIEFRVR